MKRTAYKVKKAGSFSNLHRVEEELREPFADEVTVHVKSFGLNFADIFAIFGLYSATPKGEFIPGLEFSGVVLKCGSGVTKFNEGDRVFGAIRFGAYTDHLNIEQRYVRPLPDDWSFEDGAAFAVQSLTAYYSLVELGAIKKGYTVLIHSAAGGVGLQANRIAKKFDSFTIGTVGNSAKINLLRREGYHRIIVRDKYFKHRLREALEGRELNIVLESIGGEIFKESFRQMAPMGRLVTFGAASFASPGARPNYLSLLKKYLNRPVIDPLRLVNLNKSVMGFNLIWLWDKIDYLHFLLDQIMNLGIEKPYIGRIYEFGKLVKALEDFRGGQTEGKIIINT